MFVLWPAETPLGGPFLTPVAAAEQISALSAAKPRKHVQPTA